MKLTIALILSILSLTAFSQTAFNTAENGLLVREKPDTLSSIIGKLKFGEKVQIIERTDAKLAMVENGNKIEARWYKITSAKNKSLSGYVFSGFLTNDPLSKQREIQLNEYTITISASSEKAFKNRNKKTNKGDFLTREKCIEQGLIHPLSEKEVEIKLADESTMILKKNTPDEQFFGYTFTHYDSVQKIYFFWENWFEAGHPIMIEASTGKISKVVGSEYAINSEKKIIAFYGEDINSGWTPNGIQLFSQEKSFKELFTFDPSESIDEQWGPTKIIWKNASTLLIECLIHNADSGYTTIYKKLKFEKE